MIGGEDSSGSEPTSRTLFDLQIFFDHLSQSFFASYRRSATGPRCLVSLRWTTTLFREPSHRAQRRQSNLLYIVHPRRDSLGDAPLRRKRNPNKMLMAVSKRRRRLSRAVSRASSSATSTDFICSKATSSCSEPDPGRDSRGS